MKTFANYLLNKKWILRIVMHFLSKEKQERIIIAEFRSELAFFGHDTSGMTDEEIKEAIVKVGNVISQIGFTVEEMADTMRVMARCNLDSMKL